MANLISRLTGAETQPQMTRRGFLVSMTAVGVAFGFPQASNAAMNPAVPDGTPVTPNGDTFEPPSRVFWRTSWKSHGKTYTLPMSIRPRNGA